MEKYNLEDSTFLIPLRIDTVNRLENILASVDFILSHFDTHIKVLEASGRNNELMHRLLPRQVDYSFVEDLDRVFHRTRYINQMVKSVNTEYIIVWDTDVIVPISQILKSIYLLRGKEVDFITPFKDRFLDTSSILRDLFLATKDVKVLEAHQGKMKPLYTPNPVGGVFLAHRHSYVQAGMENERFYGWGREDGERINRWKILGLRHQHVVGNLYHLSHERGINSSFHSPVQDSRKMAELRRTFVMSKDELLDEISRWG